MPSNNSKSRKIQRRKVSLESLKLQKWWPSDEKRAARVAAEIKTIESRLR